MTSSALTMRLLALFAALTLAIAACGGDDDAPSTTEPGDGATETTIGDGTDDGTDTTAAVDGPRSEAMGRAVAGAEAIEAVIPPNYTTSITEGEDEMSQDESDVIFAACLNEGDFDIEQMDDITEAVASVHADGPADAAGMPGPSAAVEVRVFESASAGDDAFGVLERIFGTEEGRECLVNVVTESMGEMATDSDMDFAIDPLEVPGADIGTRITIGFDVEGFGGDITIDMSVAHDGDIATYGSFFSFGDPFPADLQAEIMSAG